MFFLDDNGNTLSPEQTRNLEGYQRRWLSEEVLKTLENGDLPTEQRAFCVLKWYYQFAMDILKAYQDCRLPFGGYVVAESNKTPMNLLSGKGEEKFQKLIQFQEKLRQANTIAEAENLWHGEENDFSLTETLLSITIPLYFDTSLYKDFTPLFEKMDKLVMFMGIEGRAQNSFSINSGCQNGCPHCGIEATAPQGIFSMPYPVKKQFSKLNLVHQFTEYTDMGEYDYDSYPWRVYNASDNVDYYDPVFNLSGPDRDDFKAGTVFLTKGINPKILKDPARANYPKELKKYDALCLCRDMRVPIQLSVVSLGYETIFDPKVRECVDANKAIFKGALPIIFMTSDDAKTQAEIGSLMQQRDSMHEIAHEGRAIAYQGTNGSSYSGHQIAVEADGSVYMLLKKFYHTEKVQGYRYAWRALGNFIAAPERLNDNLDYLLSLVSPKERMKAISEDLERFPWGRPAFMNASLSDKVITEFPPILPRLVGIHPTGKEKDPKSP